MAKNYRRPIRPDDELLDGIYADSTALETFVDQLYNWLGSLPVEVIDKYKEEFEIELR